MTSLPKIEDATSAKKNGDTADKEHWVYKLDEDKAKPRQFDSAVKDLNKNEIEMSSPEMHDSVGDFNTAQKMVVEKQTEGGNFYNFETFDRTNFSDGYRQTNCCTRWFYCYSATVINKCNRNDGKFGDEDLLDMNIDDDPDCSMKEIIQFKETMKRMENDYIAAG